MRARVEARALTPQAHARVGSEKLRGLRIASLESTKQKRHQRWVRALETPEPLLPRERRAFAVEPAVLATRAREGAQIAHDRYEEGDFHEHVIGELRKSAGSGP